MYFSAKMDMEYEQFFDLKNDPWETTNLVTNKKYGQDLSRMKSLQKEWEEKPKFLNQYYPKEKLI